jgi:DNA-binding Lrp family transcriptional regulator
LRAYIVISAEAGKSRDVARQIAALPRVKMADACWGSRDVFAVIEVRKTEELNQLVMDQIQRLGGVKETSTHIALDD